LISVGLSGISVPGTGRHLPHIVSSEDAAELRPQTSNILSLNAYVCMRTKDAPDRLANTL